MADTKVFSITLDLWKYWLKWPRSDPKDLRQSCWNSWPHFPCDRQPSKCLVLFKLKEKQKTKNCYAYEGSCNEKKGFAEHQLPFLDSGVLVHARQRVPTWSGPSRILAAESLTSSCHGHHFTHIVTTHCCGFGGWGVPVFLSASWGTRKADSVIQSESEALRTRSTNVQGQERTEVPAQEERGQIHHFTALFHSGHRIKRSPPMLGRTVCFYCLLVQVPSSSRDTLTDILE